MLGSLSITYYSGRTNFYNHNTVLLLFVAAAAWFCWRAFADRSPRAWLVAGSARIASAFALRMPERPLVLLDGDMTASPWLSVAQVRRHGVLWVGDENSAPPPGLERHWVTGRLWWSGQLPEPDPSAQEDELSGD